MKKKTIILLWLVTAYSCSNYSSRLKAVLDYSGTTGQNWKKYSTIILKILPTA